MTTRPTKTETLAEEDDVELAESQADALPVTKLRRERKKSQPKRAGCLAGKAVVDKPVPGAADAGRALAGGLLAGGPVANIPVGPPGNSPGPKVVMALRDIQIGQQIVRNVDVVEIPRPRKSPKDACTQVEQVDKQFAIQKIGQRAIVTPRMVDSKKPNIKKPK